MNVLELFKKVTTFAFDIDGVLTDGSLLIMPKNVWVRKMDIKDGYAMQHAVKAGYNVIAISGGFSEEVKDRLKELGVKDVFMKVGDKAACLEKYVKKHKLNMEEVLYMGDDLPDFEIMKVAGLPCCPQDAIPEIKAVAQYISPVKGGEGCARDVIEKTMKLRGDWAKETSVRAQ